MDMNEEDDKPMEMSLKSSNFESKLLGIAPRQFQGRPLLRKKKQSKSEKVSKALAKKNSQMATAKIQESLKREKDSKESNFDGIFSNKIKDLDVLEKNDMKNGKKKEKNEEPDFEKMLEHVRHQEHLKGKTKTTKIEEKVIERQEKSLQGFKVVFENSKVSKESKKIGKKQEGFLRNSVYGNTRNIRAPLRSVLGRPREY